MNSTESATTTTKTYAPTMIPISVGKNDLSRRAFADSGGPSSGGGAGSQSMFSGWSLRFMILPTQLGMDAKSVTKAGRAEM